MKQLSLDERRLVFSKLKKMVGGKPNSQELSLPKRLVAYVTSKDDFNELETRNFLKQKLPNYMVPSEFVLVDDFPLLPNGKIDKKQLSKIKKNNKVTLNTQNTPVTITEEILIQVWQDVLGFSPVGIHDNFFEIGGDSISSIQLIAKARKKGLEMSPNLLFEHQTIAELALFIDKASSLNTKTKIEALSGFVPLNPIQSWFFETHKNAPHFWNQGMRMDGIPKGMESVLAEISFEILRQHDALRLNFKKEGKNWTAYINDDKELNPYIKIDISKAPNQEMSLVSHFKEIQENTKLNDDSLFKVIHFEMGEKKKDICLFIAHHLIIDVVSWQILMEQITTLIKKKINHTTAELPRRTTSIKDWTNYLTELNLEQEKEYWLQQLKTVNTLPFKKESKLPLLSKDIKIVTKALDVETTTSLIDNANDVYGTKTDELLLVSLVETFCDWSGNRDLTVYLERHGRETKATDYDLSNTVGWFTSFFPLNFQKVQGDLGEKILSIKEKIRNVPKGGIGYGVLKYLQNVDFKGVNEPWVVFNYLGNLDSNALKDKEEFKIEPIFENLHHELSERNYILELNLFILESKLHIRFSYGDNFIELKIINNLLDNYKNKIEEILNHCIRQKEKRYSPSDFSDVDINQDDLDNLLSNL